MSFLFKGLPPVQKMVKDGNRWKIRDVTLGCRDRHYLCYGLMLFRETAKQAKRATISRNFSLVSHPFRETFRETFRKAVKN
jgi:hypothetical protein